MSDKNKLLIICGPTATGKTSLALQLAEQFNGEIVSVDSRQVYVSMDIGTGKDIPEGFKPQNLNVSGYWLKVYTNGKTRIWGYDLVKWHEEFSVSDYVNIASTIIKNICLQSKLPILVGGTGFYIKALIDGFDTLQVPKNEVLRKSLEGKEVSKLYEVLRCKDPEKALFLNESDKKNPRRLIRAIEVSDWKLQNNRYNQLSSKTSHKYDSLFVGLCLPKNRIFELIEDRVGKRLKVGFEKEMDMLVKQGFNSGLQSACAIGYAQWLKFLNKEISKEQAIKEWIRKEQLYAKRQMTWFRKDKRIHWFYVDNYSFFAEVADLVIKWHNKS